MPTSKEKGMRNFMDAIIHIQWRARAWLVLKASVSSPAKAAKTVDCHK
jgi:hypothetical protein